MPALSSRISARLARTQAGANPRGRQFGSGSTETVSSRVAANPDQIPARDAG
jgi:hypothetical protein